MEFAFLIENRTKNVKKVSSQATNGVKVKKHDNYQFFIPGSLDC